MAPPFTKFQVIRTNSSRVIAVGSWTEKIGIFFFILSTIDDHNDYTDDYHDYLDYCDDYHDYRDDYHDYHDNYHNANHDYHDNYPEA